MLRLLKKELTLFIRDRRSVILTFLIPVILITLFAFAYGSIGAFDGRSEPVKIIVSDLDQTVVSGEITDRIDSLKDIKAVHSDHLKSKELVIRGKYPCALIIHKGLQDSLLAGNPMAVELLYDRSRDMENAVVVQNLTAVIAPVLEKYLIEASINKYISNRFPVFGNSIGNDILKEGFTDEKRKPAIKLTSVAGEKFDQKLGLIQAVAGTAILMLLFSVAGVGTSMLEEKENGTINRLLCSPLKGSTILFSKMIFAFSVSVLQLTAMFLYSWAFFGLDLSTNIPGLIFMIISTSFAVSGLGIFLAAVAKTRLQAQNLSTITILVMSAIGGSMIPLFIMPLFLQKVALLSINYWSIQGFYDIFWRELSLKDMIPKIIVLLLSGAVMSFISVRLFRRRIMKT